MKNKTLCASMLLVCCVVNLNALIGGLSGPESECTKKCASYFGMREKQQFGLFYKMKKVIIDQVHVEKRFTLYEFAQKELQAKFFKKNLKSYLKCLKECDKAKE